MDLQFLEQLTRTYENRTIDEFLLAWEEVTRAPPEGEAASGAGACESPASLCTTPAKPGTDKRKRNVRRSPRQRGR